MSKGVIVIGDIVVDGDAPTGPTATGVEVDGTTGADGVTGAPGFEGLVGIGVAGGAAGDIEPTGAPVDGTAG
eukprot:CAMPEP_0116552788 /NCGR_PEP_ID=MMETSP0397-20121206/6681_1 /TAXON_ID=216820 /ORGANISM="Cyclophora tenuis, Strain ECT3854" /LENGTH=71 /DNA_ID=CAMNT_0004077777 /DNA_START=211 /DNA_END=423 /DNA_ORIENTATION=-